MSFIIYWESAACKHSQVFRENIILLTAQLLRLTLSWQRSLWDKNKSLDFGSKSIDWFIYDRRLCYERVKSNQNYARYVRYVNYTMLCQRYAENQGSFSKISEKSLANSVIVWLTSLKCKLFYGSKNCV